MGKILALDVGKKRIGCAVSDPEARLAFPRETLARAAFSKVVMKLREIVTGEGILKIVIGLPLGEENEETDEAKSIRSFGEKLGSALSLPISYIDEFGTTQEALSKIPLRKHRRKKGFDDAVAAQIILQRYLDDY